MTLVWLGVEGVGVESHIRTQTVAVALRERSPGAVTRGCCGNSSCVDAHVLVDETRLRQLAGVARDVVAVGIRPLLALRRRRYGTGRLGKLPSKDPYGQKDQERKTQSSSN